MPLTFNGEDGKVIRNIATITYMGDGCLIGEITEQLAKGGHHIEVTPIFNEMNVRVGEKLEVFNVMSYEAPKEERRRGIYD